jgi:hypothetical protein
MLLLAVLNAIAISLHWYSIIWWFDMPMHFLGGLAVFYLSAYIWFGATKYVSVGRYIYESIITAVLLGVLWEALEFILYKKYGVPNFILLDSFSDLLFDLSGASIGAYLLLPSLTVVVTD